MNIEQFFINPGDSSINFDLPVSLAEIKSLHLYVSKCYNIDLKEGFIVVPTEKMLKKLQDLITYLEKENYPDYEKINP